MANYQFRKAGILDIPFIFNIIQEGCLTGSFSEKLMTSAGYFTVLKTLFGEIAHALFSKRRTSGITIFTLDKTELGFMLVTRSKTAGHFAHVIELCGIADEHRNQHHGSQMIQMYLATLQYNTHVVVYCTKFSKAMQHVLLNLKFKRDRKNVPVIKDNATFYLESFSLTTRSFPRAACSDSSLSSPHKHAWFKINFKSSFKAKS